ncbi:hypothetical protein JGU66_03960 [Myxococcaceae bacterium JPH2]|nr:hypothetical protein [Myxococcaceae bacterium JPH2]
MVAILREAERKSVPETVAQNLARLEQFRQPGAYNHSPVGWAMADNAPLQKQGVPVYCYNFPGPEYTYIRASAPLSPGRHTLRYEFEKTGPEPFGAGGRG